MIKPLASGVVALGTAVLSVLGFASVAVADPACATNCVVTFSPGAQTTWTVPSSAVSVSIAVAGGAGGSNTLFDTTLVPGGGGGTVSTELGTTYDGETLHILVGAKGQTITVGADVVASGGGGSYVSVPGAFLVIAGGGGGAGQWIDTASSTNTGLVGGDGGWATTSADGAAGEDPTGVAVSGSGAIGAAPGGPAAAALGLTQGGTGTVASVAPDGTIAAGDGGAPGNYLDFPVAQGGGGLAGGGGGSSLATTNQNYAGAGGGGSAFLASGLTGAGTTSNASDGVITITYSLPTLAETGVVVDWRLVAGAAVAVVLGALFLVLSLRRSRRGFHRA
ncbi:MAG: glycine-rich domain-containing protein [Pseudolysinimonas sp.]